MSINTGLAYEIQVCLREKEAYNNKRNIIYFGAMIFEVWGRIFLQVIIFKAPSMISALCLLKFS